MIPLTITVDRYNDIEKRTYNCQVAVNKILTPRVVPSIIAGASLMFGNLPPNHTIEYKGAIGIEGFEPIVFENVSTAAGLREVLTESTASIAMLMNNPYKKVNIKSFDFEVRIVPKNILSHIWSIDLSDSKVKAGEQIEIEAVLESVLAGKKRYRLTLKIPTDLKPGVYDLKVLGWDGYKNFLTKAAPYRFTPENTETLISAINDTLSISRNRLYFVLSLPSGGVMLERAELPDLPATKALVLSDAKRTLTVQPYQHWIEDSLETGTVVIDQRVMRITVEK